MHVSSPSSFSSSSYFFLSPSSPFHVPLPSSPSPSSSAPSFILLLLFVPHVCTCVCTRVCSPSPSRLSLCFHLSHHVHPHKVGGPAYRIGLGGGAASSRVGDSKTAELDFNAVQRGDAEMENRLNRLMRACVELGEENPIISIHDQVQSCTHMSSS